MTLWMAMPAMFSYFYLRDGGFEHVNMLAGFGIMLVFWLFGFAGIYHLFKIPVVSFSRDGDVVVIREYRPFGKVESRYPVTALSKPAVRKIRDQEGDDQHICVIETPDGREITIASYSDAAEARAFVSRLSQELTARA